MSNFFYLKDIYFRVALIDKILFIFYGGIIENFNYNIGTKILFGKDAVSTHLEDTVKRYGNKVLFVYDDIPVKASGL